MKKLRILIPVFFIVLALWACGGKQEAAPAAPQTTAAQTAASEAPKETVKETEKATEAPETKAPETEAKTEAPETEDPDTQTEEAETEEAEKEAAPAEEAPEEEAAAEEEEPEDSFLGEDYTDEELTKDGFVRFFDMTIEDNGLDKDSFFVEFEGKTYRYDDLGDLFEVLKDDEGGIVNLMGEYEEELDFGIIAGYLAFMSDMPSWDDDAYKISQEFIDRFYGDWHGVVRFEDRTGKYVEVLDNPDWVTSIARFYIDSDGYVVPFIGLNVEDTPIMNLEAYLDPDSDCMYLSGSWISVPFEDIPMTEKNGTLHAEIPISKAAGSVKLVFNFRHLNDIGWTDEDPKLPEDYVVHCQGWSFDQLAQSNGYSISDYVQYSKGEEPEYPVQIVKEEKEEYGMTTKDADGILSKKKLQEGYDKIMAELDKANHDPVFYERARDWFGKDGAKAVPAQWNQAYHIYEWQTEDGKDWVRIRFRCYTDGSERLENINQSDNILNRK